MLEISQLVWFYAFTIFVCCLALGVVLVDRFYRTNSGSSARFGTVRASTHLSRKVANIIGEGVETILPVGTGAYPFANSSRRRKKWEYTFEEWVRTGVCVQILLTHPSEETSKYWHALSEKISARGPGGLTVYVPDKNKCSSDDVRELDNLRLFHPVLFYKKDKPLGMWIESYHPEGSTVAYNVEYIAESDLVDSHLGRFMRIRAVLERLIVASPAPPSSADSKLAA